MDCQAYRNLLYRALDNDLPDGDRAAFEAHRGTCPGCAREIEEHQAIRAALRALPDQPVSEGFRARWQEALSREMQAPAGPAPRRTTPLWARRRFQVAVGLAAAGILAVAIPWGPQEDRGIVQMGSAPPEAEMELEAANGADDDFGIAAWDPDETRDGRGAGPLDHPPDVWTMDGADREAVLAYLEEQGVRAGPVPEDPREVEAELDAQTWDAFRAWVEEQGWEIPEPFRHRAIEGATYPVRFRFE